MFVELVNDGKGHEEWLDINEFQLILFAILWWKINLDGCSRNSAGELFFPQPSYIGVRENLSL